MTELHYLSATEALARFRAARALAGRAAGRRDRPRRGGRADGERALPHVLRRGPRAGARGRARATWARARQPRPLEGIPVAIKEEEAVAGQPWTQGSLLYKDLVADRSSGFAQRILDAGAIVHARTTAPEFSCAAFTHSQPVGRHPQPVEPGVRASAARRAAPAPRSPPARPRWPAARTSAARSASRRRSTASSASSRRTGGCRRPPPFNLDTYCHGGPMARTVADCALFENVMAGPAPIDHVSLRAEARAARPSSTASRAAGRALASPSATGRSTRRSRRTRVAAAEALRDAGAIVEEVDLVVAARRGACAATAIHFAAIFGAWIASRAREHRDLMTAYAIDIRRAGAAEVARRRSYAARGSSSRRELYAPVGDAARATTTRCLPDASATRGLVAGDDYVGHGLEVGGRQLDVLLRRAADAGVQHLQPLPGAGRAVRASPTTACPPACRSSAARTTTSRRSASAPRWSGLRPWLDAPERRPALVTEEAT